MNIPRVIVSHGGVQYSYELALALQELGALERFYTTFCYTSESRIDKIAELFPPAHRQKIMSYLRRRGPGGVNGCLINQIVWPEFTRRACTVLLGKNYFTSNKLLEWQNWAFDSRVAAQLKQQNFDVLIALSGSGLRAMETAKRLGRVIVLDQHDIHFRAAEKLLRKEMESCPELSDTIPYWPPVESYLRTVEREMEIADYILVPSTFALRTHLEHGIPKEKLILMPHATQPPYESVARQRKPDGKFRVLFVGTITQRKGLKYLLEAIRDIDRPDVELVMVGDKIGSSEPISKQSKSIRWVPYVEHDRLRDYFNDADVFILPTIYDAFGLSALEAMAAGLPVIVSENCVAGSDVVRDGIDGFVVPIGDSEAIRDRLTLLAANEDLRIRMGESGRERVKEFGWASYKERWKQFLGEVQ